MKVVKADAKGRVTGFEPGESYLRLQSKEGSDTVYLIPESELGFDETNGKVILTPGSIQWLSENLRKAME